MEMGMGSQNSLAEGGGETDNRPSSAPSGTRSLSDAKELSSTMGLCDLVGGVMGVLDVHGDAEKMGKCISMVTVSSAGSFMRMLSVEADKSTLFWYAML